MTEAEWLESKDPEKMLDFVKRKSKRKSRLFACACCRLIWDLQPAIWREAIETSEKFADGQATEDDLEAAFDRAFHEWEPSHHAHQAACWACCRPADTSHSASGAAYRINGLKAGIGERTASLVRDVFRPFRPVSATEFSWRTSTVLALAQAIYTDRAFDRLPILADALEDAGCDNADILNHCRQPSPTEHVRGCWVVDLILGKK
jgi:hypothetical protein